MLNIALVLFVLAALTGLWTLIKWLTKKDSSRLVIYSHGIFGATGLGILAYYSYNHPDHFPKISLYLFLVVALVGFYMFFRDLKGKDSAMALALIHAVVAILPVFYY